MGERWISDELYTACDSQFSSELSAVSSYVSKYGIDATKRVWEQHWQTWFGTEDVAFLSTHGINTVRIPLGFFSLSVPSLLEHTEYSAFATVYVNCWTQVCKIVEMCAALHIGVLLDLHCLPGGQNNDAHSGTDSQKAEFYSNPRYRHQAMAAVRFLIDYASAMGNVVGVQAMNEPMWGTESVLEPFYEECLKHAARNNGVPLYIGDAWNIEHWSRWVGRRTEFCVVDHHYYYCFTDEDRKLSPQQHIDQIRNSAELSNCGQTARGNIVVGEWSLATDPESKRLTSGPELGALRQSFGYTQLAKYIENIGGCFFWTYKFQVRNNDNDWDIKDMIAHGSLPNSMQPEIKLEGKDISGKYAEVQAAQVAQHVQYWSTRGSNFEHWRYEDGFALGWNDALTFARARSYIGYVGEWSYKRRQSYMTEKGQSDYIWEFDAGFAAGLKALVSILT